MRIAVSTNFVRPETVDQLTALCEESDVRTVEIWGHDGIFGDAEDLTAVAAVLQEKRVSVSSLHAPYTVDSLLAAAERDGYLARFDRAVRKAVQLGARYLVVHPPVVTTDQPLSASLVRMAQTEGIPSGVDHRLSKLMPASFTVWRQLAARAADGGLRVAFENLPRSAGWPGGCRVAVVRSIAAELHDVGAGVCLDLSHCFANEERPFDPLPDRMPEETDAPFVPLVIHGSDGIAGSDRHLPPGEGDYDWDELVAELCRIGFPGPFVLEVRSPYLSGHLVGRMARFVAQRAGGAEAALAAGTADGAAAADRAAMRPVSGDEQRGRCAAFPGD